MQPLYKKKIDIQTDGQTHREIMKNIICFNFFFPLPLRECCMLQACSAFEDHSKWSLCAYNKNHTDGQTERLKTKETF